MSTPPEEIDLSHITPEQYAALIASADDDLILRTVRGTGTGGVIDRVFAGMRQRFLPDKARTADVRVQWVVRDEGQEFPYTLTIKDGTCQVAQGTMEAPTVRFTLELLPFLKLTAGQANGQKLFITGKLKVGGNPMVAAGVQAYFEAPRPA